MWLMKNCSAFCMMVVRRLLCVNGQSMDRKQLRSAISIISRSHPTNNKSVDCIGTLAEPEHDLDFYSVTFHPTAPIVATCANSDTVKLWRLSSDNSVANCVATIVENGAHIHSIAFHPTAPILATCSDGNTLKLWLLSSDNHSAICVATLEGRTGWVDYVKFHPTLPLMATGSVETLTNVWRLNSDYSGASLIGSLPYYERVCSIDFHPTEPLLVIIIFTKFDGTKPADFNTTLYRISSDYNRVLFIATLADFVEVWSIAFHPTLPILATGSYGNTTKFWRLNSDCTSVTCVATLEEEHHSVCFIAFHPSAPLMVTCSMGDTAKVWRLNSDNSGASCIATLGDSEDVMNSVTFHQTLPLVVTAGNDGKVKFWC
jgi:WD40 repeat protein